MNTIVVRIAGREKSVQELMKAKCTTGLHIVDFRISVGLCQYVFLCGMIVTIRFLLQVLEDQQNQATRLTEKVHSLSLVERIFVPAVIKCLHKLGNSRERKTL